MASTMCNADVSRHASIEAKMDRLISTGHLSATTLIKRRRLTVSAKPGGRDQHTNIDAKQPARVLFVRVNTTDQHHEQQRLLAEKNAAIGQQIEFV